MWGLGRKGGKTEFWLQRVFAGPHRQDLSKANMPAPAPVLTAATFLLAAPWGFMFVSPCMADGFEVLDVMGQEHPLTWGQHWGHLWPLPQIPQLGSQ